MSTAEQLLTAEEFLALEDKPEFCELVQGVVIAVPPPGILHGLICCQIAYLLRRFLDSHDVGRVLTNDSGVITQRDPDTVRGGDVMIYTFDRLPREDTPSGYAANAPNVVFGVRSPSDAWSEILEKVAEYLGAGVEAVCVMMPENASAHLFYPNRPGEILNADDDLMLPAPWDGFEEPVSAFFKV